MIQLLQKVNAQDLFSAIGNDNISSLCEITGEVISDEIFDKTQVAKLALSIYGYDILYETRIRQLIFTLISKDKIIELANKYCNKSFSKVYDNALLLSRLPWRSGSNFVSEIASELNINKKYLPLKINRNQTTEFIDPIEKLGELHYFQEDLKHQILDCINNSIPRFLIQMPTGAGKTRTVIEAIIQYINSNNIFENDNSILWLAHTEELCEQAIDTLKEIWKFRSKSSTQIVRFWSNYEPSIFDIMGTFIFSTFQKMYSVFNRKEQIFDVISNKSLIIIVDEAHKIVAPTYMKTVENLIKQNKILIGITATPGRGIDKYNENLKLANIFHNNLLQPNFSTNPIVELRNKGYLSKINRIIINTGIDVDIDNGGEDSISSDHVNIKILKYFQSHVNRNKIIINLIIEQVKLGNPCLVFTISVEHARLLSSALNYYKINSAYIDYNMRRSSRRRIIEGFKNCEYDVLFNYGVLSTGFDAPRIRTVIITRPTSSIVLYSQMIGRGLRGPLMGGAEFCTLVDIVDNYLNYNGIDDVYTYFNDYWTNSSIM